MKLYIKHDVPTRIEFFGLPDGTEITFENGAVVSAIDTLLLNNIPASADSATATSDEGLAFYSVGELCINIPDSPTALDPIQGAENLAALPVAPEADQGMPPAVAGAPVAPEADQGMPPAVAGAPLNPA